MLRPILIPHARVEDGKLIDEIVERLARLFGIVRRARQIIAARLADVVVHAHTAGLAVLQHVTPTQQLRETQIEARLVDLRESRQIGRVLRADPKVAKTYREVQQVVAEVIRVELYVLLPKHVRDSRHHVPPRRRRVQESHEARQQHRDDDGSNDQPAEPSPAFVR